ncbi:MAG: hypothetical protein ABWY64_22640 [Tardiphaga sp.]
MTLVSQALHNYANLSPPKFDRNERLHSLGASEVGQCERKMFWLKNEDDPMRAVPRDEGFVDTWGARARGTVFEDRFWYPAMRRAFGSRLKYAGRYQRTFSKDFLSATPDGLIVRLTDDEQSSLGITSNCIVVECKTIDPRANLTDAKPENVFQTHVQMGLVRDVGKYWPTHSVISYTDASFWSDVKEFVIPFDENIYQAAQERAAKIISGTPGQPYDVRDFKPEGWIAGGAECRYCPFTAACGIERRNLPFVEDERVDPQFAVEIRDMALDVRRAEDARDDNDARVRELQNEIKNRLREKGLRRIPNVVVWSPVKGRSGYDNKGVQQAAIAAGVDIEQFATTGEPSDRLQILVGPKGLIPTK